MSLQKILQESRELFLEKPEYEDGPKNNRQMHTQTVLTAVTTVVDTHLTTVPIAARVLVELTEHPDIDWDAVDALLIGWDGVMESLRDIVSAAITFILRLDAAVEAEESRRLADEKTY